MCADSNHGKPIIMNRACPPGYRCIHGDSIKVLIDTLCKIGSGTEDFEPPYRAMPRETMQDLAHKALDEYEKSNSD